MNINKAIVIGRLTRDPEIKSLPSGQQVTNFSLATDRFYNDKEGNKQQQTEFHNIVAFGKLAEVAGQYLKKGSLAFIEGRIQTRSWEDTTGNKKYKTEIICERLQLGPRSTNSANIGNIPTQTPTQPKIEHNESNISQEIPIIEENEEIDVKDIPF